MIALLWRDDGEGSGERGGRRVGAYDIPRRPLRQRFKDLPLFVVTRGGEYCFMPGLRALDWLGRLTD